MNGAAVRNVREWWGEHAPDWVLILAERCDQTSQQKAAVEIGYSATVINQVLKHRYSGSILSVEAAVRGAYMEATVMCPVLGPLAVHRCLHHQRQKFSATNQLRVRLYRACRSGCKHSKLSRW